MGCYEGVSEAGLEGGLSLGEAVWERLWGNGACQTQGHERRCWGTGTMSGGRRKGRSAQKARGTASRQSWKGGQGPAGAECSLEMLYLIAGSLM